MSENELMQNKVEDVKQESMKFCKHCGKQIDSEAVLCIYCGKQVEILKTEQIQPQVVINNTNSNVNANANTSMGVGKQKNKWVSLLLCVFLGGIGGHKFYEGKTMMGVLYLIFCWTFVPIVLSIIDFIAILLKPNPYYI